MHKIIPQGAAIKPACISAAGALLECVLQHRGRLAQVVGVTRAGAWWWARSSKHWGFEMFALQAHATPLFMPASRPADSQQPLHPGQQV